MEIKMETQICPICNKKFKPNNFRKYCSSHCSTTANYLKSIQRKKKAVVKKIPKSILLKNGISVYNNIIGATMKGSCD